MSNSYSADIGNGKVAAELMVEGGAMGSKRHQSQASSAASGIRLSPFPVKRS
jgi:hypothetical protein